MLPFVPAGSVATATPPSPPGEAPAPAPAGRSGEKKAPVSTGSSPEPESGYRRYIVPDGVGLIVLLVSPQDHWRLQRQARGTPAPQTLMQSVAGVVRAA